ncbi:MAG: NAD-dependent epimerase/dehydratase family protein [Ruminococcus sp.]|nr:NAD-dependent epimerase/dehydratase family protein [Ruminococcus sp.]
MKKVLITGKNGGLSIAVSDYLDQKDDYTAERISLRDNHFLDEDFSDVDSVVHIAGVTPQNAKSEEDYYHVNTLLTQKLAEKCKKDGVRQFIYISSMAVYGVTQSMEIDKGTVTEDTPLLASSKYGKSKLQAEQALEKLSDESFSVAIVRVPSIYGKGKTEYLDQYRYLAQKLPFIPVAFDDHYKSAICVENLCELIALIIRNDAKGVFCPDDGLYAAVDFCSAIYPEKKRSRLFGRLMEIFLGRSERILDYYGTVCYSKELSDIFEGQYRIKSFKEAVRSSYEP